MFGSVAWAGFVMNRTVLDPGRSERLAEQLFDNEALRSALVDRLAAALGAAIPDGGPAIPDQLLRAAADAALDDPSVQAVVRDGIVATHRNALEGNAENTTIDATAVGVAARSALVEARPELATVIPELPPVAIELPTSGLSRLGAIKDFVERVTIIFAAMAVIGAATALVITSNRPAVLRRVAYWAFGAAAFWLIVGYGIPLLADSIAPSSGAIVVAIIDVFFGAMIGPALVLAALGVGLIAASMLWASASARRPAHAVQPMRRGGNGDDRASRPRAGGVTQVRHAPTGPTRPQGQAQPQPQQPGPQQPAPQQPQPQQPPEPRPAPVRPDPQPQQTRPSVPPAAGTDREWVEGVGYVDEARRDPFAEPATNDHPASIFDQAGLDDDTRPPTT